jgi:hypothetical protein
MKKQIFKCDMTVSFEFLKFGFNMFSLYSGDFLNWEQM